MLVALIMAVITYFLQNPKNSEERKKALLGAAAAGAITYGVTEYTDWGQANLKPLDSSIGNFFSGGKSSNAGVPVAGAAKPNATGSSTPASGFWDTLQSWGPTGTALVAGVGTSAVTGSSSWLLPLAIGAGVLLVVK